MAELGIQKKQRRIWPWVIGLLIIALLVWAAFRYTGAASDLTGSEGATDPAGSDAVAFTGDQRGRADAGAA